MTDTIVTRFFAWWNGAYRDDAFTRDGFARFFTEDAPFIVDGGVRGTGPAEIAAHFGRIRATTDAVELTLPVKATLADATTAFVHYGATFRSAEAQGAEECLAVARLRDGRIARFEVFGRML